MERNKEFLEIQVLKIFLKEIFQNLYIKIIMIHFNYIKRNWRISNWTSKCWRFPKEIFLEIVLFSRNFYNKFYAFSFKKSNTKIINDFNSYLSSKNIVKEISEWNIKGNSNLTLNKSLNRIAPTIKVGISSDTKSIYFEQNNDIIGYEIFLLYEFAS